MTGKTIGAWLRRALGGHGTVPRSGTDGVDARIGRQVLTNEGSVLGTITAVWQGVAGTDGVAHGETLGVVRPEQDQAGMLYIPAQSIARVSEKGVVLAVDEAQVVARGWRLRPEWLPRDEPREARTGTPV